MMCNLYFQHKSLQEFGAALRKSDIMDLMRMSWNIMCNYAVKLVDTRFSFQTNGPLVFIHNESVVSFNAFAVSKKKSGQ